MTVLQIEKSVWSALKQPVQFDGLLGLDGVTATTVVGLKELHGRIGYACVYRGENGIVEGLACLATQGW